MIKNKLVVATLSILIAAFCITSWSMAVGAALDMAILYSGILVDWLQGILHEDPLLADSRGLARFMVGMFVFILPMPILFIFAGVKAVLLPRNVCIQTAWSMEIKKAEKNTWLLFANLSGNQKERA